jgi:hypothetical protein
MIFPSKQLVLNLFYPFCSISSSSRYAFDLTSVRKPVLFLELEIAPLLEVGEEGGLHGTPTEAFLSWLA